MEDKKILGIDEAGRGPVIGPMVICGALIKEDKIAELDRLNPVDSKKLSSTKREAFRKELVKLLDGYQLIVIDPVEIDKYVIRNRLNYLEINKISSIINYFKPNIVYVDSPLINTSKLANMIKSKLDYKPHIISENRAERYRIVAAASILAKTKRDQLISALKDNYGELGSGYCHDPKTLSFLKYWVQNNRNLPDIVRKSWFTSKKALNQLLQKTLF